MPRVTVWVSDELLEEVTRARPGLKKSAAMQAGLRAAIACEHLELECRTCGEIHTADGIAGPRLRAMFESITWQLRTRIAVAGYEGAARIVRQVAADHGVPGVLATPVPRQSRAEISRRREAEALEHQGDDVVRTLPTESAIAESRREHPTAKEATA